MNLLKVFLLLLLSPVVICSNVYSSFFNKVNYVKPQGLAAPGEYWDFSVGFEIAPHELHPNDAIELTMPDIFSIVNYKDNEYNSQFKIFYPDGDLFSICDINQGGYGKTYSSSIKCVLPDVVKGYVKGTINFSGIVSPYRFPHVDKRYDMHFAESLNVPIRFSDPEIKGPFVAHFMPYYKPNFGLLHVVFNQDKCSSKADINIDVIPRSKSGFERQYRTLGLKSDFSPFYYPINLHETILNFMQSKSVQRKYTIEHDYIRPPTMYEYFINVSNEKNNFKLTFKSHSSCSNGTFILESKLQTGIPSGEIYAVLP